MLAFAAKNAYNDMALKISSEFNHVDDFRLSNFKAIESKCNVLQGYLFDDGAHHLKFAFKKSVRKSFPPGWIGRIFCSHRKNIWVNKGGGSNRK